MTDDSQLAAVPSVVVKQKRSLPIVWIIPIVAALVAGWVWWQAVQERGPIITLHFETAEGLEAGKTLVKHREVEIGVVQSIALEEDLSGVVVKAMLKSGSGRWLTSGTRFWVVRPRVDFSGITGLGTLLSGAYIEIDPSISGEFTLGFTGLEQVPPAPADAAGLKLVLESPHLHSLNVGAPIYHRGLAIGQVEGHRRVGDIGLELDIYIDEQHRDLIHAGTRFWNAGGIHANLGADGIRIDVATIEALVTGGIECETPPGSDNGSVLTGHRFELFADHSSTLDIYTHTERFVMYFEGSVRGLSVGAPVELRGIKLGEVEAITMILDPTIMDIHIPVIVSIQPERIGRLGNPGSDPLETLDSLVEGGLRAQLETANLLTGTLFVDLQFHPEAPARLVGHPSLTEIPTVPSTAEQLITAVSELPLIVKDVHDVIGIVRDLVGSEDIRTVMGNVDQAVASAVRLLALAETDSPRLVARIDAALDTLEKTMSQASTTLAAFTDTTAAGSELNLRLNTALSSLASSMRSLSNLTEYLSRHPEALLTGKGDH